MTTTFSKGLAGVIAAETTIGLVDGENGRLLYRGYDAKTLALHHSFEEVAHLLWYGHLPSEEELQRLTASFKASRTLPDHVHALITSLPREMSLMSVLRTALSSMETAQSAWPPQQAEAERITAVLPTMIAARYRHLQNEQVIQPDDSLSHIENFLYMLSAEKPEAAHVEALTAYSILTMEHGMNASTFSARVVVSSESDFISGIVGAIGTMKGPLHGGAPSEVIEMLNEIRSEERAYEWLDTRMKNGEKIMGFGHRVYKTTDPRAEALKEKARQLADEDPWLALANHVETTAIELLDHYKPGRKLYTNVEFYAAAIMRAIDLNPMLFTPIFTMSRTVGWTAHILEQAADNRIFRPRASYIGKQ